MVDSGRAEFKVQALLTEKALLAATTHVDLNPVRANIAAGISKSHYTSAKARNKAILKAPEKAHEPLLPLIGTRTFNMPNITAADYIELVDFTGRELHPGKRGRILASEPMALTKLGLDKNHWTSRVKGIGSGYWRFVGEWQDLVEKAKALKQRTIFGTGFAKLLNMG